MSKKTNMRTSATNQQTTKRVAVVIPSSSYTYGRERIKGVIDYYRKHSEWEIEYDELLRPFIEPSELVSWEGDGVIGEVYSEEDVELFKSLGVPFVNTSSSELGDGFYSVSPDNHAIGQMAARHLTLSELDHFVFVGATRFRHVEERYQGFAQSIEEAGAEAQLIRYEPREQGDRHNSEEIVNPGDLIDALRELPKPVGIFASSDLVGFAVLNACRELNLRCPEEVMLVCVDNDELYCHSAPVTMSSIDTSAREIGHRAAELLNVLMQGKAPQLMHVKVPPSKVVERNSTSRIRSKYPEVARALRFIRNRANELIDVTSVVDVVPVSRRWLEIKFKEEVGHGISQEIRRVHVEYAKQLLKTTELPIQDIASESGFPSVESLETAFVRLEGIDVREFRK